MGTLSPKDVKFTIYAEKDTQLQLDRDSTETHEVVISMLRPDTPEDIFMRRAQSIPEPYILGLHVEYASPFSSLYVTPHSRGGKTITFYLTYKDAHGEWRTRSRDYEYYVYGWKERNEWWITWIAVFAGITGIWANLFKKRRNRWANKGAYR